MSVFGVGRGQGGTPPAASWAVNGLPTACASASRVSSGGVGRGAMVVGTVPTFSEPRYFGGVGALGPSRSPAPVDPLSQEQGGFGFNATAPGGDDAPASAARASLGPTDGASKQDGDRADPEKPPPVTYVPEAVPMDSLMAELVRVGLHFDHITQEQVQRDGDNVDRVPVVESFDEASLDSQVLKNIRRLGYEQPTPVQRNVLPLLTSGRDVLASAQTGSGKTAAFLLPIISRLIMDNDVAQSGESKPRALVIVPTRELAIQITQEARKFAYGTKVLVCGLYGGVQVAHHAASVQGASVAVATMGRLRHFLTDGLVRLDMCKYLVIDEVDRMLLAFDRKTEDEELPELIDQHAVKAGLRPAGERHTAMFSATMDDNVKQLAQRFTKDACVVGVGLVGAANRDIVQKFITVTRYEKKDKLLEVLKAERDEAAAKGVQLGRTLVFVNDRKATDILSMLLSEKTTDIPAISIHGLREQQERETALLAFRTGKCRVLIATAVCERGLDIKDVDHVLNYDLPDEVGQYVHRIGRTGRVGHTGRATSFYETGRDDRIAPGLYKILTDAGQDVPDFLTGSAVAETAADDNDDDDW